MNWPEPTSYVDSIPAPVIEPARTDWRAKFIEVRAKYRTARNLAHQRQRIIGMLEHRIDKLEAKLKAVTR